MNVNEIEQQGYDLMLKNNRTYETQNLCFVNSSVQIFRRVVMENDKRTKLCVNPILDSKTLLISLGRTGGFYRVSSITYPYLPILTIFNHPYNHDHSYQP